MVCPDLLFVCMKQTGSGVSSLLLPLLALPKTGSCRNTFIVVVMASSLRPQMYCRYAADYKEKEKMHHRF